MDWIYLKNMFSWNVASNTGELLQIRSSCEQIKLLAQHVADVGAVTVGYCGLQNALTILYKQIPNSLLSCLSI